MSLCKAGTGNKKHSLHRAWVLQDVSFYRVQFTIKSILIIGLSRNSNKKVLGSFCFRY